MSSLVVLFRSFSYFRLDLPRHPRSFQFRNHRMLRVRKVWAHSWINSTSRRSHLPDYLEAAYQLNIGQYCYGAYAWRLILHSKVYQFSR